MLITKPRSLGHICTRPGWPVAKPGHECLYAELLLSNLLEDQSGRPQPWRYDRGCHNISAGPLTSSRTPHIHCCFPVFLLTAILLCRNWSVHMQIRTSVVPTQPASLRLWISQHRRGLLSPKLRCVAQILCFSGLVKPPLQQYQENVGHAPLHEVVDPPQVEMGTALNRDAVDLSVPARLRRLAGRYVSNPYSIVNGVRLEPGPSGRFQIVITIDIGDILGDSTD